jgi:hypothetical protein
MSGGPHERAGLISLNASRNAEWEITAVTTELPKEGADRWTWVAQVVAGASTALSGLRFYCAVTSPPFPGSVLLIACKPRHSPSRQGVGWPFVNRRV